MLPFSLSVVLSMTDVSVSRGFLLDSEERTVELLIFISPHTRTSHTHTRTRTRTHTRTPTHTLSLIQSQALPVTFISVITMAGRLNGEIHTTMDTHHIDIWITHVWINHTTLMWLVDEALKQLTDRGHLRWESL